MMSTSTALCRASKEVTIEKYRYRHDQPPKEVDWRKQGVVGPIKSQHKNGAPVRFAPSGMPLHACTLERLKQTLCILL